jgi:hypothetical protein
MTRQALAVMPSARVSRIGRLVPRGLSLGRAATHLKPSVEDFNFYLLRDRIPQPISECVSEQPGLAPGFCCVPGMIDSLGGVESSVPSTEGLGFP